jgi:hypothetical protein
MVLMLRHLLLAIAFVGMSLGAGMLGYLYFENENVHTWRDAFSRCEGFKTDREAPRQHIFANRLGIAGTSR